MRDFSKAPEIVWLDRYFFVPPLALAIALYLAGGMPWLVWGFCLPTTTLAHATFAINTVNHMFGSRRFDTIDESRNNVITAFFAVGEGWHNNHHRYQRSARNGFYWWEFDPTWYTIRLMAAARARLGRPAGARSDLRGSERHQGTPRGVHRCRRWSRRRRSREASTSTRMPSPSSRRFADPGGLCRACSIRSRRNRLTNGPGGFSIPFGLKGFEPPDPLFGRNRDAGSFSERRFQTEFHQGRDCHRRGGVLGDLSLQIDRHGAALDAGQRGTAGHADGERAAAARRRDEAGDAGARRCATSWG